MAAAHWTVSSLQPAARPYHLGGALGRPPTDQNLGFIALILGYQDAEWGNPTWKDMPKES